MGQTSVTLTWVSHPLHTLLTLPAVERWHLCQMSVKNTTCNRQLTEELYTKQPIGFKDGTGQVCRLVKSIYGPKQA
jgi:Reverse transcriptase (RNA-dependent DNA polymerase)